MSGRPHPPSQMRAILQEWKRGAPVRTLLPQARSIGDPSFAAEALLPLATDPDLPAAEAKKVALEALRFVDRTERDWRRGEALAAMAAWLAEMRRIHPEAAVKVEEGLADRVLNLPAKARSDAMRAAAGHFGAAQVPRLMARALAAGEEASETGKAILKAAVEQGMAAAVLPAIRDTLDPELRARMLGAWASRMAATQPEEAATVLDEALHAAAPLPATVRLDVGRSIVASLETLPALHRVHLWAKGQDDETAARILSALGARADRIRQPAAAATLLKEASARAERIADDKARASVQRNVQEGLRRAGVLDEGVPPVALPAARGGAQGQEAMRGGKPASGTKVTSVPELAAIGGRHVLALVDTYEGGLGEVHLRAVARAAPLCDAFGLDLALVGFPVKDVASFVKRAGRETNIGEGRGSLEALHRAGRLHLVIAPEGGVPDLSGLGMPVATTPKPDAGKAATEFPVGQRLCVLVGLGPRGLPEVLLRSCPVHVELTGKGVSLETATAMGVIAERMRTLA